MERQYEQRNDSGRFDSRNGFPYSGGRSGTLVHTTSGTSSLDWLLSGSTATGNPASADYLINRDGTRHKITPKGIVPYHAGISVAYINGRRFVDNNVSAILVGVELEQVAEQQVTYEQYDSLAELLTLLSVEFGWRWPYTIFGHYEVARPVGRRSDPCNFAWGDFMGRLYIRSKDAQIPGL